MDCTELSILQGLDADAEALDCRTVVEALHAGLGEVRTVNTLYCAPDVQQTKRQRT
jgi:hypothetical protein